MRVDQATTQPQPSATVASEAAPPALADSAVVIPYNSSSPSQFAQLLNAANTTSSTPQTPSATTPQTPAATTPSPVAPLPATSGATATPAATPSGSAALPYSSTATTESGVPTPYGAATTGTGSLTPSATVASPYASIPSTTAPYGTATSSDGTTPSPYVAPTTPYATTPSPYGAVTSPYGAVTSPYGATQTPYGAIQTPYGMMVEMPMMVLVPYGLTPYGMATAQSQGVGGASGTATTNPDAAAAAGSTQPVSLIAPFHSSAPITQPFGPTSFAAEPAYNGYSHFHTGLDFGVPMDTPIDAAAGGRVVSAGWDNTGFGNCVVIDHGNGLRTLYGHLSSVSVQPGQIIQAGQQIGLSGTTGNSTGPHLHFGVEQDGKWVDPAPLLGLSDDATSISDATATLANANAATTPALPGALTTPAALGGGTAATDSGLATASSGVAATSSVPAAGTASASTGDIMPAPSGSGMAAMLPLIQRVATATGVSESLLAGVVQAESGGDPQAVSPSGAKGLMQLMDGTARTYGVIDPFDPQQNLVGGAMYLRSLLQRYHGDQQLAVAAYNAGPGAVDKYGGVPPYAETQQYVQRVAAYEQQYSG